MADGTANIYTTASGWSAITADVGEQLVTVAPISAADLFATTDIASVGEDHPTHHVFPTGTESLLLPSTSDADIGSTTPSAPAFSFGGSSVRYVMRALAQDDGAYVVWEVSDEPDDAGIYAPETIVPGSAVVASYRLLVSS